MRRSRSRVAVLAVAVLACLRAVAPASAATFTVPSPATPTIASALALATAAGDSVEILPGTYAEHDLVASWGTTLRGAGGADVTILDAEGLGRALSFDFLGSGTVQGLTIMHGAANNGAGILGGPELVIRDCALVDNHATYNGGAVNCGIGIGQFPLRIVGTVMDRNSARLGGAVFTNDVALQLEGCVFRANEAVNGGALYATETTGSVTDCLLVGNVASSGGAICFFGSRLAIATSTFHGNEASTGGAIAAFTGDLTRCIVAATRTAPGAPAITCASTTITCCDFFGNDGGDATCGTDTGGNFSADPLFCDVSIDDFHLDASSPCLPGHHPDGMDCGTIGALGRGCGLDTAIGAAPWSRIKAAYR